MLFPWVSIPLKTETLQKTHRKGWMFIFFPGWKCHKLFFLGPPSPHPPPNTPSRAGFQVSEILGFRIPSEDRWQLKRFGIFTLHSFPLGGFSMIQWSNLMRAYFFEGMKLETGIHQAPETALAWGTRSLHWSYGACAQLGSFLPWRPWTDALQGWDAVAFWRILGGFLVQGPKNTLIRCVIFKYLWKWWMIIF